MNAKFCPTCQQIQEGDFCPRDGTRLVERMDILAGKFILKQKLGAGTMGEVWEAEQPDMGRRVAVKLLHKDHTRDPEMVQRFEREAVAVGQIDHPNVITVYDRGRSQDGRLYLAMEYLEGESLTALLERDKRLEPARALSLWLPVVKAMAAAHRKRVVHRDLKPDNIFIARKDTDGEREELVKVLDFGIAKLQALPTETAHKAIMGTFQYMAPEQMAPDPAHPVGTRADVYALGLILCEMLTGRLPWSTRGAAWTMQLCYLRLTQPPQPLCRLCPESFFPAALQALLDDVLAMDPDRRPADAGQLLVRAKKVLAVAPPPWSEVKQTGQVPAQGAPASDLMADEEEVTSAVEFVEDLPDETTSVARMEELPDEATSVTQMAELPGDATSVGLPPEPPIQADRRSDARPTVPLPPGPPSRWRTLGAALGFAALVVAGATLLWPRGKDPDQRAPQIGHDSPVDMARRPLPDLRPVSSPPDMRAPAPSDRRPPPPLPPPPDVVFIPKAPAQVTLDCGKKRMECNGPQGCRLTLPRGWKCTASKPPIYQPRTYKSADRPGAAKIVIELPLVPIPN